jgi:hypothetical protein
MRPVASSRDDMASHAPQFRKGGLHRKRRLSTAALGIFGLGGDPGGVSIGVLHPSRPVRRLRQLVETKDVLTRVEPLSSGPTDGIYRGDATWLKSPPAPDHVRLWRLWPLRDDWKRCTFSSGHEFRVNQPPIGGILKNGTPVDKPSLVEHTESGPSRSDIARTAGPTERELARANGLAATPARVWWEESIAAMVESDAIARLLEFGRLALNAFPSLIAHGVPLQRGYVRAPSRRGGQPPRSL